MLPLFPSPWLRDDHQALADAAARLFAERWVPQTSAWRAAGRVPREVWREAGAQGLLCAAMPEAYGGAGGDFGHEAVIALEQAKANISAFGGGLHSAIVAPYLLHHGTEDQRQRWLPRMATGELITAIAMTEPGAGSDLQGVRTIARREGDAYVLSGSKIFITNGQNAQGVIVVCKTDPTQGAKGTSLLFVEVEDAAGNLAPGFSRGRNLDKIGMHGQDTSELFFDGVRVPVENLIGGVVGQGFFQLMNELPQERLLIAVQAMGGMERGLAEALKYTQERQAFGKRIWDFQNTRFQLAEAQAQVLAARSFVDQAIVAHLAGQLDAARAALLKSWITDLQCQVLDVCLQLHGGYGYMMEYPIAELWADARVARIYGGSNEIMKELASRSMGGRAP